MTMMNDFLESLKSSGVFFSSEGGINYPFLVLLVFTAILTTITIYAPRRGWLKTTVLVAWIVVIPLSYLSLVEQRSLPKPIELEFLRNDPEVTILHAEIKEGVAVYLYLGIPGVPEPRSYVMDWKKGGKEAAQALAKAMREAQEKKGKLKAKNIFKYERSLETRDPPMFYMEPQEKLPDKPVPKMPEQYKHPSTDA